MFPHEILVLSYASSFLANGENSFAGFWWYKYGIKDVMAIVESLKDKRFIEIETIEDSINLEKLPIIKEKLKKYGLKVSGEKQELVERLIENVSEEELCKVFYKKLTSVLS